MSVCLPEGNHVILLLRSRSISPPSPDSGSLWSPWPRVVEMLFGSSTGDRFTKICYGCRTDMIFWDHLKIGDWSLRWSKSWKLESHDKELNALVLYVQHFSYLNWRYLPCVRSLFRSKHVRDMYGDVPKNMVPGMVKYLKIWYLKTWPCQTWPI